MKHVTIFLLVTLLTAASALASDVEYVHKVTITNVTRGQTFTPILVASHRSRITLFETGAPANPEITAMAESGNIEPLMALLHAYPGVYDIADSGGLFLPV